jgi:hypothetical protein
MTVERPNRSSWAKSAALAVRYKPHLQLAYVGAPLEIGNIDRGSGHYRVLQNPVCPQSIDVDPLPDIGNARRINKVIKGGF